MVYLTSKKGILQVAIGVTILHTLFIPVKIYLGHRMIKLGSSTVIRALFPQTASALLMFGGIKCLHFLNLASLSPLSISRLIVSVLLGVSIYTGSLLILRKGIILEVKDLIIPAFARPQIGVEK